MFTPTPQAKPLGICECDTVAVQPPADEPVPSVTAVVETPVELLNFRLPMVVVYAELSEKYASSAVTRLRRSDFMAVMYAFCFVLANFGIAIAAKMPMITTTIKSSMSVKPLRFSMCVLRGCGVDVDPAAGCGVRWGSNSERHKSKEGASSVS